MPPRINQLSPHTQERATGSSTNITFTFTFRAFSRRLCAKRLTISPFVRRKCISKSLLVKSGFHKNKFLAPLIAKLTDCKYSKEISVKILSAEYQSKSQEDIQTA